MSHIYWFKVKLIIYLYTFEGLATIIIESGSWLTYHFIANFSYTLTIEGISSLIYIKQIVYIYISLRSNLLKNHLPLAKTWYNTFKLLQ